MRVSVSPPIYWGSLDISKLDKLKSANSIGDLAVILGYKAKALAFIIYGIQDHSKYSIFEIQKAHGGTRTIKAPVPKLKKLQKRLSELLQDCIVEINDEKHIKSTLSHGFRREYSIVTNAALHVNRKYVFNIDISDFFGTINFGRVRGYFIKNNNFKLDPTVATIIAQIACHEGSLPQGSPCSPVISNLIGHILDIRLASLAKRYGCTYSRYADDITFSTNKKEFPSKIAKEKPNDELNWAVGRSLHGIIDRSGFSVNASKTRMQLRESRQDVTGLVVNKKVNTRWEYRHQVRAMVYNLRDKGSFFFPPPKINLEGNAITENEIGTIEQLNGMLSFIHSVNLQDLGKAMKKSVPLSSFEKIYHDFLFYKDFYASDKPVIICEGKTDNIYLKAAIERNADVFPSLVKKDADGKLALQVRIYNYTKTTGRLLRLSGGTGDLCKFLKGYKYNYDKIKVEGTKQPIILLIDNDDGAHGKGGIYTAIKEALKLKDKPNGDETSYSVYENLFVIPTPKTKEGESTMVEDFFEEKVLKTKLNGKTFNPSNTGFDKTKEYGKYYFATQVIKKKKDKISFEGFVPILKRISDVL